MNIGLLIPILAKVGAPILSDIIRRKSPDAGRVVDAIGSALGVEPTPEAINERFSADPDASAEVIRNVEADSPEMWEAITAADQARNEIFARDQAEGWFGWAWRPAWMYLLAALWTGSAIASFIEAGWIDSGTLLTLTGIFSGLYMGGHTALKIWGRE